MLKSSGFGIALFINIIIIALWHFLSYLFSAHLPGKYLHDDRPPFRIKDFENRGDFYVENFSADKWYRSLPGHPLRSEVSAAELRKKNLAQLRAVLISTCRIELWSILNCLYFICSWSLNAAYLAFILSAIVIISNFPYIICARYSRCLILNEIVNKRKELAEKAKTADNDTGFMNLYFNLN